MYFDAKAPIEFQYFREIRFQAFKPLIPVSVYMNVKPFRTPIKKEDIEVPPEVYVRYQFEIKQTVLNEKLLFEGGNGSFEFITPIEEKEISLFLDYILPYFGVIHYGFLPMRNQSSGLTKRILSNCLTENKEKRYDKGEIKGENNETELLVETGDEGFYYFRYPFSRYVKLNKDEKTKEYFTSKHEWIPFIEEMEKIIQKNRIKILFEQ